MPTTTPLTDAINALTTYANTVTGASDTTLSDAVATLAAGYGVPVRRIYKFSENQLIKINGAIGSNTTYGLYINKQSSSVSNRRVFALDYGDYKLYETTNNSTFTESDYYPIPVPPTATKVSVEITPSTQYFGISCLTESGGKYTIALDDGWKQGSRTITFTAGTYSHIIINCKYNSSGSAYQTEPTELTITFE